MVSGIKSSRVMKESKGYNRPFGHIETSFCILRRALSVEVCFLKLIETNH